MPAFGRADTTSQNITERVKHANVAEEFLSFLFSKFPRQ